MAGPPVFVPCGRGLGPEPAASPAPGQNRLVHTDEASTSRNDPESTPPSDQLEVIISDPAHPRKRREPPGHAGGGGSQVGWGWKGGVGHRGP